MNAELKITGDHEKAITVSVAVAMGRRVTYARLTIFHYCFSIQNIIRRV